MKKILVLGACLLSLSMSATNYGKYNEYINISFEDGTTTDAIGNAQSSLEKGAVIVEDAERGGKVMKVTSAQGGYLALKNDPMSDQMTLSFWYKREDVDASAAWRMMFSFIGQYNNQMYFSPKTSWGEDAFLVNDNREYSVYQSVKGTAVKSNTWVHYAFVFNNNTVTLYQNGVNYGSARMTTKLTENKYNSWSFGNNATKTTMDGRMDDIRIFHTALSDNQILALKDNKEIPVAQNPKLPFVWLPLDNDLSDAYDNVNPTSSSQISFITDAFKGNVAFLNDNQSISMPMSCVGSGKYSVLLPLKRSSFTSADDNKIILKLQKDSKNYEALKVVMNDGLAYLQMVKVVDGVESNLGSKSKAALKENEWNMLAFVQTFSAQGTPALRVYLNKAATILVTKENTLNNEYTSLNIGSDFAGLSFATDDVKIFQREYSASEVNIYTDCQLSCVSVVADVADKHQVIRNFGASDGFDTDFVGKYMPLEKKAVIADMLFNSTDFDSNGNPCGIGLSAWRFNIGAGTFEQGKASRITTDKRRTECFRNADGTYNWEKQEGQRYFLGKAAKTYGVKDLIGWQNSPPVAFTVRGLGFREYGDAKKSILKREHYTDFGNFLADVITHFKGEGINLKYISPLNEPQWDWSASKVGGEVSQEGTPWTNEEIRDVTQAISKVFTERKLDTKLFLGEAGAINCLLGGTGVAYNQLNELWTPGGKYYLNNPAALSNIVSSHSYFTDGSASAIVSNRQSLKNRLNALGDYEYWQTEYCLLQNGYLFGHPSDRTITPMESAISFARILHNDLATADATGWQWWTSMTVGETGERWGMVNLALNKDTTDGIFYGTKILYTMGNYSRFVRPGMKRVSISRSDNMSAVDAVTNQMFSAYYDEDTNEVVIVAVNASQNDCSISLDVNNMVEGLACKSFVPYLTSEQDNLVRQPEVAAGTQAILPGTSVTTFVGKADKSSVANIKGKVKDYKMYPNKVAQGEVITIKNTSDVDTMFVSDLSGRMIQSKANNGEDEIKIETAYLSRGLYIVTLKTKNNITSKKFIID